MQIEGPNNRIYKFDGSYITSGSNSSGNLSNDFDLANANHVSLNNNNVALRGMSLRNTEFVIGVVVYTGHDSKIQMNSAGAVYKTSNV